MSNNIAQFRQFRAKKGPQSINTLPYCKFKGTCPWKRQKSHNKGTHCGIYPDTCNQQVWGEKVKK